MKTITKLFALTGLALFTLATQLKAQETTTKNNGMAFKVGVGAFGGLFPDKSEMDYGFGGSLRLQYDLSKNVALTASGGYTKLQWKNSPLDFSFIPLMGGVKVFAIDRMYLGTALGTGLAIKENATMNFIYSGGLGYEFSNGIDIGARYEGYVNNSSSALYFMRTGQYTLNLSYNFKL